MPDYDWTRFTKRIPVSAALPTLYPMLASRSGMESWFLRRCEFSRDGSMLASDAWAQSGDQYLFYWYGWPDTTFEKGKILFADGESRFEFTFDGNGQTTMSVHIQLEEMANGTMVELTQINIPDDLHSRSHWHLGCLEGWTFYLSNLKSIAEGGLDLRNKNEELKGVINA